MTVQAGLCRTWSEEDQFYHDDHDPVLYCWTKRLLTLTYIFFFTSDHSVLFIIQNLNKNVEYINVLCTMTLTGRGDIGTLYIDLQSIYRYIDLKSIYIKIYRIHIINT